MARTLRFVSYVLFGLALALAIALAVFSYLTRTEGGVDRVREIVVRQLEARINGEARIGRIEPGALLAGVTVHDFAILDHAGRPFIQVDSARLSYRWRALFAGQIAFDRATLYGPEVNLERLPGHDEWNFQRIFADTTPPGEPRLIRFDDVRVVDGAVTIRMPLALEPPVEPGDTARLVLEAAPGGLVRVIRFEDVNAELPHLVWEQPDDERRVFDIAALATRGYIWEDPFDLRGFRGAVAIQDSIISLDASRFELGGSRGSLVGRVVTGEERLKLDLRIDGDDVAFRDLRWLYPPLPAEGGGELTLSIQSQPQGTLWLATDARLEAPGTRVAGTFGIVTGDTLYFTNVNLRASPLDLELVESMLPVDLPVEGLLVGTVIVDGPLSSLDVRGDMSLEAAGPTKGTAVAAWTALLDLRPVLDGRGGARLVRLDADVERLDLALAGLLGYTGELSGSVSGRVAASGSLGRDLRFDGEIQHARTGYATSRVRVTGQWNRTPGEGGVDDALDVQLVAAPLDLDALAALFPQVDRLRGQAAGTIRLAGSPAELEVAAELSTSAGLLALDGLLHLAGPAPRYDLQGRVSRFQLHELVAGSPRTELAGRFSLNGEGAGIPEMRATARVELDAFRLETLDLPEAWAALTISEGVAHVDSLRLSGPAARLEARGAVALQDGQYATLEFQLSSDSVAALRAAFLPDTTQLVAAADTAGGGSLQLTGALSGNLGAFDIRAEGPIRAVSWEPAFVDSAMVRIGARQLGTDTASIEATVEAGSLTLYHRRFVSGTVTGGYRWEPAGLAHSEDLASSPAGGRGEVRAQLVGDNNDSYMAAAEFQRAGDLLDVVLREAILDVGPAPWGLAWPGRVTIGGGRLSADSLGFIRADGGGSIRARGVLPVGGGDAVEGAARVPIDFGLDFQGLRLADVLRVLRPGLDGSGSMAGSLQIRGVAGNPSLAADLTIREFRHDDVLLDRIDAQAVYQDQLLELRLGAERDGRRVVNGRGHIPVDLALTSVPERRLAQPIELTVGVDSLPLVLVTALLDGFSRVDGHLDGAIEVSGTTLEPKIGGTIGLQRGAAAWAPVGVRYRDVNGTFRFLGNRVIAVDATARADAGRASVNGTISFERSMTDPEFDLVLSADGFQASRRRDVDLVASGQATLRGPFSAPSIEGTLRVDRGTLNIDELVRQYLIIELDDPFLIGIPDSVLLATAPIEPKSAFLKNMRVNANVIVGRDSWLRSREMNVEVTGEVAVEMDRAREDFRLTGTLNAVRGNYQRFGRRFTVRQGVVEFVGTPAMDPNLDITAVYRARTAHGDPLDIQALVTGTLQRPTVTLTSDVQPPISESDLYSYLLSGRPTYALAAPDSRALDRITGLGVGFVGPAFWGYASSGLETFAQSMGLDYFAITAGEGSSSPNAAANGLGGLLAGTQVEVGRYLPEISPNLFLALSQRITGGGNYGRGTGARVEWQFQPTWTAELFVEDRFLRTPSFGLDQTLDLRKVYGFTIFREWGFREWFGGGSDAASSSSDQP